MIALPDDTSRKSEVEPQQSPLDIWIAYNDASNAGDHARAGRYIAEDLAVAINGLDSIASADQDRAIQAELLRCFPDYTREFLSGFASGDHAVVEWRMRGTAAPSAGLRPLDLAGCSIVRCVGGRMVEAHLYHSEGPLAAVTARALGRDDTQQWTSYVRGPAICDSPLRSATATIAETEPSS